MNAASNSIHIAQEGKPSIMCTWFGHKWWHSTNWGHSTADRMFVQYAQTKPVPLDCARCNAKAWKYG
jgi:hypothetical protein